VVWRESPREPQSFGEIRFRDRNGVGLINPHLSLIPPMDLASMG
jgi:hypothetical protein